MTRGGDVAVMRQTAASRSAVQVTVLRVVVLLALAVALGLVHVPGRPRTLCLLRALTGVPCPFCGGTTAAVQLGRLRPLAALQASPLVVLGAAALTFAPLAPRRVVREVLRRRVPITTVALAAGEIWQLHRLG